MCKENPLLPLLNEQTSELMWPWQAPSLLLAAAGHRPAPLQAPAAHGAWPIGEGSVSSTEAELLQTFLRAGLVQELQKPIFSSFYDLCHSAMYCET